MDGSKKGLASDDAAATLWADGQAALWLCESLILALIEARILDTDAALKIIDTVIAAKRSASTEDEPPEVSRAATAVLSAVSASIAAARVNPPVEVEEGRSRETPLAEKKP